MKNFFSLRRSLTVKLVGVAGWLAFTSVTVLAVGGGAAGGAGTGATGGVAAGGGHGGGVSVGGGGLGRAGGGLGAGGGGRIGNVGAGQHLGTGFGGASAGQHLGNPGFSGGGRLVSPNFGNLSHPTFGNGVVGNTGNLGAVGGRSITPGVAPRFGGTGLGTVASPRYAGTRPAYQSTVPTQPRNAWTDPRVSRPVLPAARTGRYGYGNAYDAGQGYLRNQTTPGQHLYPNAPDYATARDLNGHLRRFPVSSDRNDGYGGGHYNPGYHHHGYRNYYTAAFLYPYFYGGFFPGFYGGYDDGFGSYAGIDTPYSGDIANGETNTPSTNPGNYGYDPNQGQVTQPAQPSDEAASLPPNQPAQVGPSEPQEAEKHITNNDGPDSLVEAVQQELSKRGYLSGKVDGVYGDGTRAALERFQADQKLSRTGRINEATLHALQLD